jgi:Protein of unknown function (DUF2530)
VFYAARVSNDSPSEPAVPQLKPLDPPTVPFAVGGMVIWAVLGLSLLPFRSTLDAHGHSDWIWICLAGFLVGFPGLAVMIRHDRNRRVRRAAMQGADEPSIG